MIFQRKEYKFDTVLARYLVDQETGAVSLTLLPSDRQEDAYDRRRTWLEVPELVRIGMDARAWQVGSLVHRSVRGEAQGNGAGNTLKYGASTRQLRLTEQSRTGDTVTTRLRGENSLEVCHRLTWLGAAFRVETEVSVTSGWTSKVLNPMRAHTPRKRCLAGQLNSFSKKGRSM